VTVTPTPAVPPGAIPRAAGGPTPPAAGTGSAFAGFATRVLAFAADAAVINAVVWFVALVVALCLSLFPISHDLKTLFAAVGAAVAVVWSVAYFVFFWSADGQTPGDRLLRIRVQDARTGGPLRVRRALARVLLLPLSALPFFAGFLMILVDRQRRALHDRLVHSVVVYAPELTRRIR
jgi:uncharacterized RDD family membrane protein YckC